MKAHAATVRSRATRAACTLLGTGALAGATLHPVEAQAPRLVVDASCAVATSGMILQSIGTEQCFTVPAGVRQIEAGLIGGSGGIGFNPVAGQPLAGDGATAIANVYVTPGEVLYVDVGGSGAGGGKTGGAGAFNGGAAGGRSALSSGQLPAGGGGGATDLRTRASGGCGTTPATIASLASRILVAGGGGGGGETNANSAGDNGGHGGSASGTAQTGTDGSFESTLDGRGGGGATGTAPGKGGAAAAGGGTAGLAGTSGCAGAGGSGTGAGGGGGGYFGGGGGGGGAEGSTGSGGGGGGGAGSSYANPLLTCDGTFTARTFASSRLGPRAVIVFPPQTACPTLAFVPDVSSGGFAVQAVGGGWAPGLPVNLSWGELGSLPANVAVGTFTPSASTFTFTILLMTHDAIGERALIAQQPAAGRSNVASLLVAVSPAEPPTFLFRR